MRLQRSLPAAAAVAVLMLAITACGGQSPAEAPGEPSATVAPVQTEAAAASPSPAPVSEPVQAIQGTGTYIGQIDNHSVEIETEEGPTAFELGAGTEEAPALLEMDDTVIIEYVEKPVEGDPAIVQRVLSRLEKADGGKLLPEKPCRQPGYSSLPWKAWRRRKRQRWRKETAIPFMSLISLPLIGPQAGWQ